MTSHTSTMHDDIEKLRAKSLAVIARVCALPALAAHVDAGREEDDVNRAEIRELKIDATKPLELLAAMRAPIGTQSVLDLDVPGRRRQRHFTVVVNGLGGPHPDCEHEAWLQLRDLARMEAA